MSTVLEHKDGVPWHKAPLPYPWHKCQPQTWGWSNFDYVERCACGAIRLDRGIWLEKNATRKFDKKVKR